MILILLSLISYRNTDFILLNDENNIEVNNLFGVAGAYISYLHGRDVAFQVSLLRGALYSIKLSNSLEADIERGINALFPITSGDLIPEFNGKELGDKLRALKLTWLKSNFSLTKDELLS